MLKRFQLPEAWEPWVKGITLKPCPETSCLALKTGRGRRALNGHSHPLGARRRACADGRPSGSLPELGLSWDTC